MKEKIIETKVLVDKCPYCNKEIQAYTESQMKYNMDLHKDKCKKVNGK